MNESEISKLSPGPYQWCMYQEGPKQIEFVMAHFAKGTGDVHAIGLPKHSGSVVGVDPYAPEHLVLLCMTGNGPNSKNNAIALSELLNQRHAMIELKKKPLPIPVTPDAVAWAEYAIELENALGIAYPIPDRLAKMKVDELLKEAP